MRIWLLVFVLGACGGSKATPPAPVSNVVPVSVTPEPKPADPPFVPVACDSDDQACVMHQFSGFADAACKCKEHDTACANKVTEEITKWGTEMAKKASDKPSQKPTPEFAKQASEIMTRYTDCLTKAMMPADTSGAGSASVPTP